MQSFSRFTHIALVAFGVALGAATTSAQDAKAATDKVKPSEPCCSITAIDMETNTVTGKVTATGATFTMKVAEAAWLKGLKVGGTLEFRRCVFPLCGGDTLEVKPSATGSTSSAATTAGGTTTKGNNSPRNADTRPKDCIATTSSGAKIPVACPSNVPVNPAK